MQPFKRFGYVAHLRYGLDLTLLWMLHARLIGEPSAYGKLGLANLLEMWEECLRGFQFVDAYRNIKQRMGFVQQDDVMFPRLIVKETLTLQSV